MKNKNLNLSAAVLLALIGTWCLPFLLNLKGNYLTISNSFLSVFIWGASAYVLYYGLRKLQEINKKSLAAAGILGLLFAVSLAFGAQLDYVENVTFTSAPMWISILVWTVIFTIFICLAWSVLEGLQRKIDLSGDEEKIWDRKRTLLVMCFFLLCWIPVLLAVYPGFFVYDAQDELVQMQTRNFTTHHPLPHVLLLGTIVMGVNKLTGSYNLGIAAYSVFQMVLMAGVFTYFVYFLRKRRVSLVLRIISICYFAFFPVILMFVLCSAKDGIFSAALLILILMLADLGKEKELFFTSWKKPLAFFVSTLYILHMNVIVM